MKKRIEAAIQKALVAWIKETYPNVRVSVSANEGNHFNMDMGIDAGEPDLWLYCNTPDNICHFLRLELKTMKGKNKKNGSLNDNQIVWNEWFDKEYGKSINHKRAVAYGFKEAREIITNWLNSLTKE